MARYKFCTNVLFSRLSFAGSERASSVKINLEAEDAVSCAAHKVEKTASIKQQPAEALAEHSQHKRVQPLPGQVISGSTSNHTLESAKKH